MDQRILQRTPLRVAVDALHGVGPQHHVVLLLLLEAVGHVVGVEQRERSEGHPHEDHHHAVAEREKCAAEFHP